MSECSSGRKECATCDGSGSYGDGLVDLLVNMATLQDIGSKDCPTCDGRGTVVCADCNGAGCD
jgi:DnaJ-class molecular chaperone